MKKKTKPKVQPVKELPTIVVPVTQSSKPKPQPPKYLNEDEAKRFIELAGLLEHYTPADASLLAEYVYYDNQIQTLLAEIRGKETLATNAGNLIQNPKIGILNKYTNKHIKLAELLGIGALPRKKLEKMEYGESGTKRGKKGRTSNKLNDFQSKYQKG